MAPSAGHDPCALSQRVADMLFDLVDRCGVDERALGHAQAHAVADPELSDGVCELLGEAIIDTGLDQETVRADAGLAGVAIFRGHCAFYGLIEIGVVEDDERGIAT